MVKENIELKRKAGREDKDYATVICKVVDDHIHDLAVLKEYLDKVGINMSLSRYDTTDILSFSIDNDTYNKMVKRGAGRKKDYTMRERYEECTVSELKTKLETMKRVDIIKELGCPKATFYRILKNIKKYNSFANADEANTSIWYYTC